MVLNFTTHHRMAVEAVSVAHFCESGDWNYSNFLEIQKVRILWMKRLISLILTNLKNLRLLITIHIPLYSVIQTSSG